MIKNAEHTLEFLLDFNGRIHCYEKGYWVKFEITQGDKSELRPHGLNYSFTLHDPSNQRLIGFDNAHGYHHRHFMGVVEPVEFLSYEATVERFQREWSEIVNRVIGKKS